MVRTGLVAEHEKNKEVVGKCSNHQNSDDILLDRNRLAALFAIALLGQSPPNADRTVAERAVS